MVGGGMAPRRDIYAFNSTIVNLQKAVKERVFYVKDEQGRFVSPPRPDIFPYVRLSSRKPIARCGNGCGDVALPKEVDAHTEYLAYKCGCGRTMCVDCVDFANGCDHCLKGFEPMRNIFDERLGEIRERVLSRTPFLRPLDLLEFPLQYVGKKRTIYQNAVSSLLNRSLERKDGYTKNFTKTERTTKAAAVPRNISPRDPRYNVEVGRYLKPAEPLLLDAVNKVAGSKTVMKGLNAMQVGEQFRRKWDRFGGRGSTVAIGLDASRFDQHVSAMALEWEHEFYIRLVHDKEKREWLRELLSWQIENKGFGRCADGTIKYKVLGTRCSGDMNTGMGNCIIASCMLIAYCEERNVPYELANNGDDCVIFTHKKYLKRFSRGLREWFLEMGFNMVVEEPVYDLEKVVFCQSQPVFDGTSWTMVRDPRSCIAKDCVSLKPWRNEKEYNSWINAVGQSGTALAGGIPVLDSFYRAFVRAGKGAKALSLDDPTLTGGLFWLSKGMQRRGMAVTDEARYSFWLAFGITPDEQVCMERDYDSKTPYYSRVVVDPEVLPVHEHGLLL
nr:hypothetical protein 2 [Hubei tombus-like virus 1]